PAERSLGAMYQGGYGGLSKDEAEARRWFTKAAEQGDSLAKFALFLENTGVAPYVRGLPQGTRNVIFFATLGAAALVALAVAVLCVVVVWKTLRRFFPRVPTKNVLWLVIGLLALVYVLLARN